jgi:TM2 domain-containing membrane protein YozV
MKDKNVAAVLALFLGWFGVHKFYLGRIGSGIVYLVFFWTMIPALLGMIDFFVLALMDNDEFNRRYNGMLAMPPVVVNMLPPQHGHMLPPQHQPPPGYGYPSHGGYPGYGYPSQAPAPPVNPDELAAKLHKLNELRIAGLLTEEEFTQQKARLLGQM